MSERLLERNAYDGPLGCEKPRRAALFPGDLGHAKAFSTLVWPISSMPYSKHSACGGGAIATVTKTSGVQRLVSLPARTSRCSEPARGRTSVTMREVRGGRAGR